MNYVLAWPIWWNPLHWLQHASATWPSVRDYNLLRLSQRERAGLQRGASFMSQGRGYQAIQGTRPQTLGYGLQDSPAGGLRPFSVLSGARGTGAGKQTRIRAPRRWTMACTADSPVWYVWWGGRGVGALVLQIWQRPHVMLSHHLGDTPSEAGCGLQGNGTGEMDWRIILLPGQCAARMCAAAASITGSPWHAAPGAGTRPAGHAVGGQAA